MLSTRSISKKVVTIYTNKDQANLAQYDHYYSFLKQFIDDGTINRADKILIVCGGRHDRDVAEKLGLKAVVISNLDKRMENNDQAVYQPFSWSYQDCESLNDLEQKFDFVIVHNGLHHCYSPHRALIEMYKTARKGIVVFEPIDSMITRLGVSLGIGQDYEHSAVYGNNCEFGGVANTEIPNFIYRWTKQEVQKTLATYDPTAKPRVTFRPILRFPWNRLLGLRNRTWYYLLRPFRLILDSGGRFLPFLANNCAFIALRPDLESDIHPWLELSNGKIRLNRDWIRGRYRPDREGASVQQ